MKEHGQSRAGDRAFAASASVRLSVSAIVIIAALSSLTGRPGSAQDITSAQSSAAADASLERARHELARRLNERAEEFGPLEARARRELARGLNERIEEFGPLEEEARRRLARGLSDRARSIEPLEQRARGELARKLNQRLQDLEASGGEPLATGALGGPLPRTWLTPQPLPQVASREPAPTITGRGFERLLDPRLFGPADEFERSDDVEVAAPRGEDDRNPAQRQAAFALPGTAPVLSPDVPVIPVLPPPDPAAPPIAIPAHEVARPPSAPDDTRHGPPPPSPPPAPPIAIAAPAAPPETSAGLQAMMPPAAPYTDAPPIAIAALAGSPETSPGLQAAVSPPAPYPDAPPISIPPARPPSVERPPASLLAALPLPPPYPAVPPLIPPATEADPRPARLEAPPRPPEPPSRVPTAALPPDPTPVPREQRSSPRPAAKPARSEPDIGADRKGAARGIASRPKRSSSPEVTGSIVRPPPLRITGRPAASRSAPRGIAVARPPGPAQHAPSDIAVIALPEALRPTRPSAGSPL
jgi:hypothetical protein